MKSKQSSIKQEALQLLAAGSKTLLAQFQYSNAFTSAGKSELAEAALVLHIGAECVKQGHAAWPESPFKAGQKGGTKHLDLLVHLCPSKPQVRVLLLEVKAMMPGYEAKKLEEILHDWQRLQAWPTGSVPLHFEVGRLDSAYAAVAVLFIETIIDVNKPVTSDCFARWWTKGQKLPPSFLQCKEQMIQLRDSLKGASRRVEKSAYADGGKRYSVAIAVRKISPRHSLKAT